MEQKSDAEAREEIGKLRTAIAKLERFAGGQARDSNKEESILIAQMELSIQELGGYLTSAPLTVGSNTVFSNNATLGKGGALNRSSGPFPDFGSQLLAVRDAALPGQRPDQRLFDIQAAATGLGETIPSEGGFLLQSDFSNVLLKSVFETGILAARCRRITISNNSNSIKINGFDETTRVTGSRFGGIQTYWLDEGGTKVKSKPKFRQIELNLKKLIGLCYASDEVIQDVTVLNQVIRDSFVSEFGFVIDDAIVNGTGAGEPLGILTSGCLVSVAKEAAQAADTIMTENIVKMYSRLLPGSKKTSLWLINKNVEPQLFTLHLDVGTGGIPVYMPANALAGRPYDSLFGVPVIECEQAATLGTLGDIILADFPNGYVLADKGGIKQDVSIHVEFLTDQSIFRFVLRIDGQPALASAITPYKGGAAYNQSHFIALATRS